MTNGESVGEGRGRGQGRRGSAGGEDRASGQTGEISLLQIVNVLLTHRQLIVLAPIAAAAVVIAISLILPSTYTSDASFMPQSDQQQMSRLAGLASQIGVEVPSGQSGQSPQFYADLLQSRELLRSAVETEYEVRVPSGDTSRVRKGDVAAFFDLEEDSRELEIAEAIDDLRERVRVSTDPETNVVDVEVTSRWASLSQQLASRLLELVNRFNLQRRRTQASAKRAFVEEQVARADSQLRVAEDSLQRFLENNRSYQNSPPLTFEHDRLRRRVTLRQQLYTSLSESYQQARIEEVRNTPVVTVVEHPDAPARPDSKQLAFRGFLGLLVGGLGAVFWAFGREIALGAQQQEPDDYAEFTRLKRAAVEDIVRLWRRLPWVKD